MPEVIVFCLRAVVLILLWGFVVAVVVAVRHDVFGTRTPKAAVAGRTAKPRRASRATPPPAAVPKPSTATLVVTDGPQSGTTLQLGTSPLSIGRAGDCDLTLTDDYASNHHAKLVPAHGGWQLQDTGSTNGTFVNGRQVNGVVDLRPGTAFRIGQTTLELRR